MLKIAVMTESSLWNDNTELLAAITDGKFVVWYYPNVVFIDDDLIPLTKFEKDGRYYFNLIIVYWEKTLRLVFL